MSFYKVTAQAQASPSVSLEKGAYRMRAPPKRSALSGTLLFPGTSTRASRPRRIRRESQAMSRDSFPTILRYERQVAMVVILLVCSTVTCFGVAYYLFTTSPRVRG